MSSNTLHVNRPSTTCKTTEHERYNSLYKIYQFLILGDNINLSYTEVSNILHHKLWRKKDWNRIWKSNNSKKEKKKKKEIKHIKQLKISKSGLVMMVRDIR